MSVNSGDGRAYSRSPNAVMLSASLAGMYVVSPATKGVPRTLRGPTAISALVELLKVSR